MEAVVWKTGSTAPLAQLSWRAGFILKASGRYDAELTTGKGRWEVAVMNNVKPAGTSNGVWGTGAQFLIEGSGIYDYAASGWRRAAVVRGPAGADHGYPWGSRTAGWMLFPSQMPDQLYKPVAPGKIMAVTKKAGYRGIHTYTREETQCPEVEDFTRLLEDGRAVRVPPNTHIQLAWHLGRYICAYPELEISGGAGARVAWCWTESSRNASNKRKGDRSAIVGKYLEGYGDDFVSDGRETAVFSSPWFRCGLWCRIDVETSGEPLTIKAMRLVETRYPLELESGFSSPSDPSLSDIRRICARAMQMCCHEMMFDCPYYEQQMYPGDTRVELLVLSAMTRDERIIRRAIELFDLAARDDGLVPFNWPTRGLQEGASYTLCYLLMYDDYVMNHSDVQWLRARLPGLRKTMAGIEYYENRDGLLENMPGWQFVDWVAGWITRSMPPGSPCGEGVNSELNLLWSLAMRSAAVTERALGNELQAKYWETKRDALNRRIYETFWDAGRGLLADDAKKTSFSEHSQALAVIAGALPADAEKTAFARLLDDTSLNRCSVYFSYYLFEAFFKMGRCDLFLSRLDLWRRYLASGLTTLIESPDTPERESRSDCHAWGAHPIWFMQTGIAGIRSDAPFFRRVRIAPQPGSLKEFSVKHPHPDGWIKAQLVFEGDSVRGSVSTPVPGVFVWRGTEKRLSPGENGIDIGNTGKKQRRKQ